MHQEPATLKVHRNYARMHCSAQDGKCENTEKLQINILQMRLNALDGNANPAKFTATICGRIAMLWSASPETLQSSQQLFCECIAVLRR